MRCIDFAGELIVRLRLLVMVRLGGGEYEM